MPNYDWSRDDTSMGYNLNTFTKQKAAITKAKRINAKRCSRDRPFVPFFLTRNVRRWFQIFRRRRCHYFLQKVHGHEM